MDLDELLNLDPHDAFNDRALRQMEADDALLSALVKRRVALGLSQEQVGARMDISQSAVARIESGVRDCRLSTIRRYAMAVEAVVEHEVRDDDHAEAVRRLAAVRAFTQQLARPWSEWGLVAMNDPLPTWAQPSAALYA